MNAEERKQLRKIITEITEEREKEIRAESTKKRNDQEPPKHIVEAIEKINEIANNAKDEDWRIKSDYSQSEVKVKAELKFSNKLSDEEKERLSSLKELQRSFVLSVLVSTEGMEEAVKEFKEKLSKV